MTSKPETSKAKDSNIMCTYRWMKKILRSWKKMMNLFLIRLRATLEETKDLTYMLDGLFKSKSRENANLEANDLKNIFNEH